MFFSKTAWILSVCLLREMRNELAVGEVFSEEMADSLCERSLDDLAAKVVCSAHRSRCLVCVRGFVCLAGVENDLNVAGVRIDQEVERLMAEQIRFTFHIKYTLIEFLPIMKLSDAVLEE